MFFETGRNDVSAHMAQIQRLDRLSTLVIASFPGLNSLVRGRFVLTLPHGEDRWDSWESGQRDLDSDFIVTDIRICCGECGQSIGARRSIANVRCENGLYRPVCGKRVDPCQD
jgi:hypothetical protein